MTAKKERNATPFFWECFSLPASHYDIKKTGLVAFQQCRTTIFFILFYENSSLVKGKLRWNTLTNETKQQNQ